MNYTYVLIPAIALCLGLAVTGLARRYAHVVGLMDKPDGRRKLQKRPVAVVGGISLFITTFTTLSISYLAFPEVQFAFNQHFVQVVLLGIAALITVAVGALDDRFNLRARAKLLGQFTAVGVLIAGGFVIEQASLFGYTVHFGVFAVPVTALWFLAAMNAINLLDGMDGLLGTLGLIIFGSLAVMAIMRGNAVAGFVAIAVVGGLISFLAYNKPPATIYMGDAGSMTIGLVVAALALHSSLKAPAVAILAPTALLVLPFLDTTAAVIRRKLTGRSLAESDRGHLHHLLQRRGLSIPQSLCVVAGLGLIAATGAMVSTYMANDVIAFVSAIFVVALLLVCGLFGMAELRLLATRTRAILTSAVTRSDTVEMEVRLQGSGSWDEVWQEMTTSASNLKLKSIILDVNAPAWQEGYHRRWVSRTTNGDQQKTWKVEFPLLGHGHVIGRLLVIGDRGADDCIGDQLMEISKLAKQAELLALKATQPMADSSATILRPEAEPAIEVAASSTAVA